MSERPTPMTDKLVASESADHAADYLEMAAFARRLERVAGALAERLKPHVCNRYICNCDICTADRAALAEWNKMKEELT